MNIKRINTYIITIVFIMVFIQSNNVFAIEFSPGIKVGLNCYNQHYPTDWWDIHSGMKYNPGLYIGSFYEIIYTNRYSTIVELAYVHKTLKGIVYANTDEYLDLESEYKYLHMPLLMKIQTQSFFAPYILFGLDFGHLLWAKYKIVEHVDQLSLIDEKISHLLPSIDVSIDIGIGKKVNALGSKILLELRYSKGLTNYRYEHVGSWRNHGIQALIGIQYR